MTRLMMLSTLLVASILGCGVESPRMGVAPTSAAKISELAGDEVRSPAPARKPLGPDSAVVAGVVGTLGTALQAPEAALARKIIYDGDIELMVRDVDPIARQVSAIVQEARGYIAEQSTTGSPGSVRSMRWKLRVPVDQFEPVVQKVVVLGEIAQNRRTSQDVTEQFYDLEARIKNKKAEEKSLTKILDERTGKLEDVLKIEAELSRVRGEIEQFEGRIRVLDSLSSLATLNLSIREREKFEPPPPAAADFPTQVSRTWENSLRGLIDLGKWVVLWAVDWVPWIPLVVVGALAAWIVGRRILRMLPRLIALGNAPISRPKPQ